MTALISATVAAVGVAGAADDAPRGYELELEPTSVTATTGDSGTVSFTISPRPGYTIDRDGPLRVDVSVAPEQGLALPRRQYRRKDAADARADAPRFDLKYRAERAGEYRVAVQARFWVCRRYTCRAVSEVRQLAVNVADPAPPPGPDAGPAGP